MSAIFPNKTLKALKSLIRTKSIMNLSFSGCGFLGIYHLGVAKTFASDGKRFINEVKRYGGASAGALIASLFAVHGADEEVVEKCKDFCTGLAKKIKSKTFGVFTPGVNLLKHVEKFMEEIFPDDAHIRASGRLFVSVTNVNTKENEIISEFSSRRNLIEYLLASCCIPHITTSTSVSIGDKKYCDGGLTNNLPTFPEGETFRVSPFEGKNEISPSISILSAQGSSRGVHNKGSTHFTVVNQDFKLCLDNLTRGLHIFSPPSVSILTKYYHQGAEDARKFLIDRGYFDPQEKSTDQHAKNNNVSGNNDSKSGVDVSNSGLMRSLACSSSGGGSSVDTRGDDKHDGSYVYESSVDG